VDGSIVAALKESEDKFNFQCGLINHPLGPVLQCLGNIRRLDHLTPCHIRNRARQLEHAMIAPHFQVHLAHAQHDVAAHTRLFPASSGLQHLRTSATRQSNTLTYSFIGSYRPIGQTIGCFIVQNADNRLAKG
jgi:hypothetical protein